MSTVHVRCPRLMAQEWCSMMPVNYDSTLMYRVKEDGTHQILGYAKTAAESTCSYFHYFTIVFIYHIVMVILRLLIVNYCERCACVLIKFSLCSTIKICKYCCRLQCNIWESFSET